MGVDHPGLPMSLEELLRVVRREAVATLQHASIGRSGLRFYDAGYALFQGGGGIQIDDGGYIVINGDMTGIGRIDWTGPSIFRGTVNVTGNSAFGGTLDILGVTRLANDLIVDPSGQISIGPILIDRNGSCGGRIVSSGTLLLEAATAVVLGAPTTVQGSLTSVGLVTGTSMQSLSNINALGNIVALGDIGGGTKSFWIDHPTKPGKQLRHGSLEGPEHGVYYRGVVEFDAAGEAVFELPGYFTALVLAAEVPTVQVTPVGRPFMVGAENVADGRVTVYGDPGREAHVTVTAARELFDVEPDKVPFEPVASEWAPPADGEEPS